MILAFFESPRLKPSLLAGLFLLLVLLRLPGLNSPIVDYHSWNQISAASMTKHIYYDWSNLVTPRVDLYDSLEDVSTIYAQEFPLYQIPVALIYHFTGVKEWPGRAISILYGMLELWFLFLLTRKIFGEKVAFIALLVAGISPMNWYYHRTIMTDTPMVASMMAGFYYFYCWLEEQSRSRWLWIALAWTAATGLFKAYGLVIGVAYLVLILLRKDYQVFKNPRLYLFGVLAWLPTLLWIWHVMGLNEGRNEFSDMNQMLHPELLTNKDFYIRMIFSRLIDHMLTPWAAVFCVIGIFYSEVKQAKYHAPLAWLAACGVYLLIVQRGNYVHDYYQLPFVPGFAILTAVGVEKVWGWRSFRETTRVRWLGSFLLLFLLHSSIYAYHHFKLDIGSYLTGKKIAKLSLSPQDRVLAWDMGANKRNQLIYYSHHTGWYVSDLDLETLERYRANGVKWLGVNMLQKTHYKTYQTVLKQIENKYPKVWEDFSVDRYDRPVISQVYDLSQPLN